MRSFSGNLRKSTLICGSLSAWLLLNPLRRRLVLCVAVTSAVAFGVCQVVVLRVNGGRLYTDISTIPAREVGLLLGTTQYRRDGKPNPFFFHRVEAAVELYRQGKVRRLLVSGDNDRRGYNEPLDLQNALLARGVPANAITLDESGFRTLESVVRAQTVFGLKQCTIISQRDHDQRALMIANHYGLDAIAYCAKPVPFHTSILAHVHEWIARVKVILDLYVLHTKP